MDRVFTGSAVKFHPSQPRHLIRREWFLLQQPGRTAVHLLNLVKSGATMCVRCSSGNTVGISVGTALYRQLYSNGVISSEVMSEIGELLQKSQQEDVTPALIKAIQATISDPKVVTYNDQYQQIKQKFEQNPRLHEPSLIAWLGILSIFTHGTWQDYLRERTTGRIPELNDGQTSKLKQLTLASLASQTRKLHYGEICDVLDLDRDELEPFLVNAIYSGLVSGKLDTKRQLFEVESVIGRDVSEKRLIEIEGVLDGWLDRTASVLRDTDSYIRESQNQTRARNQSIQEYNDHISLFNQR